MTSIKRIAAIVVTYNRLNLLQECIAALKNQTVDNLDILVINNASSDGTDASMKEYADRGDIIYYNTGENIGGAGGFNYGIKEAYKLGYELFWLMDDDTIPSPTALETLLLAADEKNYEFGYLVSKVLWTDGTLCRMNVPQVVVQQSIYNEDCMLCLEIKRATFVSFLVPRRIVKLVGLPIKEFFIWADDTNYCYRINNYAKGYCVSSSVVTHKMRTNQNVNIAKDSGERLDRYIYVYRNRLYNARMQHDQLNYYKKAVISLLYVLYRSKDRKLVRAYYILKGIKKGLTFRPSIEYVDM